MATVVDYVQYAPSTISSETLSASVSSVQSRVRTVRLVRPCIGILPPPTLTAKHGPSLGFSLRGGREHGTGFFVSSVEPGSEAHRNGLKVGDQIIRINGFTVEDAIHKEVLQLISNLTHLTLKVRSVGMIPVKDKSTDPLSWQIISDGTSSTRSSPQLGEKIHDVRISIMVAPRTKLGCGICKGPEWKPGIFIQFTKEGGIAREAGLRPGDQILYCNNVDFSDIPFSEAVNLMKSARHLDLIVRKAAGSELFPGESSGYNSSASSVTGDQSPSWSDSKRLSIVKEESTELEDRLCQLKSSKMWKEDWDEDQRIPFKPPVINFKNRTTTSEDSSDSTIKSVPVDSNCNTLTRSTSNKTTDVQLSPHKQETKTVVVEVHKTSTEDRIAPFEVQAQKENSNEVDNSYDCSSLSSALSQEIRRRMERKKVENRPTIDEELQKKKILKGINTDQQSHHTKLMDEFKLVHRKMFKNSADEDKTTESETKSFDSDHVEKSSKDRKTDGTYAKLEPQRSSPPPRHVEAAESLHSLKQNGSVSSTTPPPPPPPPPLEEIKHHTTSKNGPNAHTSSPTDKQPKVKQPPPVPVKYSCLSSANKAPQKTGQPPPPCPTPDYENLTINSNVTLPRNTGKKNCDKPEIETSQAGSHINSIDSIKFNKASNGIVKSPNNGVNTLKSSTSTNHIQANGSIPENSTLKRRPVSVVIGEYPSGSLRKQPGKLDFLQNSADEIDRSSQSSGESISSQLASELAQTLSRSNLRRRTESVENLTSSRISSQSNGTVTISVGSNLSKHFARSTDNLLLDDKDNKIKSISNRVTISIGSQDRNFDLLNNKLKTGNGQL